MPIQLHWYAQGQIIEVQIDGDYQASDVALLDFGLRMYLNTTPHAVVHCIIDGQLIPHCTQLDSLHHEKIGWVVERSAQHSLLGQSNRFQHAASTQGALLLLSRLNTQPPTTHTMV